MSYPALLHDPVLGASRKVAVQWSPGLGGTLRVEDSAGPSHDIAAKDLSLSSGGWNGGAIHFFWELEGRTWTVTVDDPSAVAGLAKVLPPPLSSQIGTWQKKNRRSSFLSRSALAVAALIGLLPVLILLGLFLMRDRIIDAVIAKLPTSVDTQIGQQIHQSLIASGTIVKDGPVVDAVRATSERLLAHLPNREFPFRFEVVNDPSVNAYAAPGGLVVVHTGLLARASSVDQLAGVLAHEVTHVTRRHSLRQLVFGLGLTTALRWLIGVPDGVAESIAVTAVDLGGLKFSREQESEADRGGVELLQKARLPASGLQSFFVDLSRESGGVPAFLSTHPADDERSAALEKLIAERGQWRTDPLALDWESVQRDATERMKKK